MHKKSTLMKVSFLTLFALLLASCASISNMDSSIVSKRAKVVDKDGVSIEASTESFEKQKTSHGTVLLQVMWGRVWKCGEYENAQIVSFSFDKLPRSQKLDDDKSDVEIKSTGELFTDKIYNPLAFQVPSGEYSLSGFKIRVAKSVSDVGYISVPRSALIKELNTFSVNSGEQVYIGHFSLDCAHSPIIWRYYLENESDLQSSKSFTKKYPFLDLNSAVYRLFKTNNFGGPIFVQKK